MIVEVALSEAEKVVDVSASEIETLEKLVHLFLEDVGGVTETHRGSLVLEFTEGKNDGASSFAQSSSSR